MSDEAFVFSAVYRVVFEQTHDYHRANQEAKTAVWAFKTTQR